MNSSHDATRRREYNGNGKTQKHLLSNSSMKQWNLTFAKKPTFLVARKTELFSIAFPWVFYCGESLSNPWKAIIVSKKTHKLSFDWMFKLVCVSHLQMYNRRWNTNSAHHTWRNDSTARQTWGSWIVPLRI